MALRIRLYNEKDKPFMKTLMLDSFHGDKRQIDGFFENVLPDCVCYITTVSKLPVGAVYLVPSQPENDKTFLVYAAAIEKQHRRCGYFTAMMKSIFAKYPDYSFVLKTDSEDSRSICKNLGMEPAFKYTYVENRKPIATPSSTNMIIREVSDDEYIESRRIAVEKYGGHTWIDSFMKLGLKRIRECGAQAVKISYGGALIYALIGKVGEILVIYESLCEAKELSRVIPHLQYRYNADFAFGTSMGYGKLSTFSDGYAKTQTPFKAK